MAFYVRIEREQDLRWLQGILDNSVAKLRQGSSMLEAASENIVRVHESVMNAVPIKDARVLGIIDESPEPTSKKQIKHVKERYKYNHCSEHPYSQIAKTPSSDCEGCWVAYKKLHPEKYDTARRNFERKLRDAQSTSES